jgi:hypothetical protein
MYVLSYLYIRQSTAVVRMYVKITGQSGFSERMRRLPKSFTLDKIIRSVPRT